MTPGYGTRGEEFEEGSMGGGDVEEIENNWKVIEWALIWCTVKDDLRMLNGLTDAIKQLQYLLERLQRENDGMSGTRRSPVDTIQEQLQRQKTKGRKPEHKVILSKL